MLLTHSTDRSVVTGQHQTSFKKQQDSTHQFENLHATDFDFTKWRIYNIFVHNVDMGWMEILCRYDKLTKYKHKHKYRLQQLN